MTGLAFKFSLGSVIVLSISNDINEYIVLFYLNWALVISIPNSKVYVSFKISFGSEKICLMAGSSKKSEDIIY